MIGIFRKTDGEGFSAKRTLWVGVATNVLGLVFRLSRLVFFVFLPRLLSVEALGTYFLVNGFVEVMNGYGCLGLDHGALRWFRTLLSDGREGQVRRHVVRISLAAAGLSAVVTGAIVLLAPWVSALLSPSPDLAPIVRAFALRLPFLAVTHIALAASRARIDMSIENFAKAVYEPLALAAVGLLTMRFFPSLLALAAVQVGVDAVGMVIALRLSWRALPPSAGRDERVDWGFVVQNGLFLGFPWSLNFLKSKIDLFLVGRLLDLKLVGIYGVCLEVANSLKKIRYVFDPVVTPLAQKLAHEGDHAELQATIGRVVTWILVPTFLAAGAIMAAPAFFLGWFGPAFEQGAPILFTLMIGQIFYAGLGISEMVFAAVGRLKAVVAKSVGLILLTVALTIPLVRAYSVLGAAIANSLALIIVNLIRYRYALSFLGLRFLTRDHLLLTLLFVAALAPTALLPAASPYVHGPLLRIGAFLLVFSVSATTLRRRGTIVL